ncbi:hypothetical protein FZ029_19265 [Azospirillum sp. Sh1]|nr:hypothetical protein FZ029_19265 [Azospirillum sp. Sh1]
MPLRPSEASNLRILFLPKEERHSRERGNPAGSATFRESVLDPRLRGDDGSLVVGNLLSYTMILLRLWSGMA